LLDQLEHLGDLGDDASVTLGELAGLALLNSASCIGLLRATGLVVSWLVAVVILASLNIAHLLAGAGGHLIRGVR